MMYNSGSIMERKNPVGVLEAFKKAFERENNKVGLVIKINEMEDASEIEKIKTIFDGYTNVYFITKNMSKIEVNSLVKTIDVFVSLHRAEGFGLGMAEAMLVGTPVITTNWSANTEFMNKEVACMVDYALIEIDRDHGLFRKGYKWADPDIEQAAGYMRKLYDDRVYAKELSDKAKAYIEDKLSMERAVNIVKARVREIYSEKR
jgi:glycosyltransferase involved in cell wall biosynthesis